MFILEPVLRLFAPYECLGCGSEGALLCKVCSMLLPSIQLHRGLSSDGIRAVTPYEGVAKQLIHYLKFERAGAAAADIAPCIARLVQDREYDVVTYVPTAPIRVRQRGYDQARLIARHAAHALKLPCVRLLVRVTSDRQVGAGRNGRVSQAAKAYQPSRHGVQQKRVLLVDDVVTTGATLQAATSVLRDAGASRVDAVAFAAAPGF